MPQLCSEVACRLSAAIAPSQKLTLRGARILPLPRANILFLDRCLEPKIPTMCFSDQIDIAAHEEELVQLWADEGRW